ncbi:MAG: hypothetical protein MUO50_11890 [Longimicrobiales bacterium]|nr:hypothetical protein [Longimicrobiales bacterium]
MADFMVFGSLVVACIVLLAGCVLIAAGLTMNSSVELAIESQADLDSVHPALELKRQPGRQSLHSYDPLEVLEIA